MNFVGTTEIAAGKECHLPHPISFLSGAHMSEFIFGDFVGGTESPIGFLLLNGW